MRVVTCGFVIMPIIGDRLRAVRVVRYRIGMYDGKPVTRTEFRARWRRPDGSVFAEWFGTQAAVDTRAAIYRAKGIDLIDATLAAHELDY